MAEPLVAYLHYLSIILTGGFLVGELVACRPGMTAEQVRRLPILDIVFFASALAALATGLIRLFFYSKRVDFYVGNLFFWVKMALHVIIATLSINPTLTLHPLEALPPATRSPARGASSTSSSDCWRSCR